MASYPVQNRRGTTAEHDTFAGRVGEVTVDTDKNSVVVHDNSTLGGFSMALESDVCSMLIKSAAIDMRMMKVNLRQALRTLPWQQ